MVRFPEYNILGCGCNPLLRKVISRPPKTRAIHCPECRPWRRSLSSHKAFRRRSRDQARRVIRRVPRHRSLFCSREPCRRPRSHSHLLPSTRRWPSLDPEKTTPGITVTAADCAGLHGRRSPHPGGGALHSSLPSVRRSPYNPPPAFGSSTRPAGVNCRTISDTATYALSSSAAGPH